MKQNSMRNEDYFPWFLGNTDTTWWHDSADPLELDRGLGMGASGVTTNPILVNTTLNSRREYWLPKIQRALPLESNPQHVTETCMQVILSEAAEKLKPVYERTNAQQGYVCAQVNPALAGDRDSMLTMARRFAEWAPNIAVKLPVTSAGLDVLEECTAEGITITATLSFTVSQLIAIAEKYRNGIRRAKENQKTPGRCFAVLMIGRIHDYLRDVAMDNNFDFSESDITQAGLAIAKRAYSLFKKNQYEAVIIVAALRGTFHMTELAGAELIMSIHPKYQDMIQSLKPPFKQNINNEMDRDVMKKLSRLPEFVRSYEPDGMPVEDFIIFGCTQRTLSQFSAAGWNLLEKSYKN